MAKPHKPGGNAGKGRPPGQPNRATRELRALASEYTEQALLVLVEVMGDGEAPHAARVHAATALLDRGHGKPTQHIEGDIGTNVGDERQHNAILKHIAEVFSLPAPALLTYDAGSGGALVSAGSVRKAGARTGRRSGPQHPKSRGGDRVPPREVGGYSVEIVPAAG